MVHNNLAKEIKIDIMKMIKQLAPKLHDNIRNTEFV